MFCFSLCVFVLFCALFLIIYIVVSFRFCVQVCWLLRPSGKPTAVNKYHITSKIHVMVQHLTWNYDTSYGSSPTIFYWGWHYIRGYNTLLGVPGCNTFYGVSAFKLSCLLVTSSIFHPISFLVSMFWIPPIQLTLVRFMSFLPLFSVKTLVFLSFWKHGFCPFC